MSKLAAGMFGVALGAVACAPASSPPNIPVQAGGQLVAEVVAQVNDAGRGASVAFGPNGDPSVSYVLATQPLKKGEVQPAIVVGQPQPPSVVVATRHEGIWQPASVSGQTNTPKDAGTATELVDKDGHALSGLDTGLAIDKQGKAHVIWSTPSGLFYTDDVAGTGFAAPTQIVKTPVTGGAIAVGDDGSSWVSFYEGGILRAAHQQGTTWTPEDVEADTGTTGPPAVTAIAVGSDGNPLVAYGANDATSVAVRASAGGWTLRPVPGPGGFGVSLALDKDGNPDVAYYDASGAVSEARSSAGGPWSVTSVATAGSASSGSPDPGWGTGIALAKGARYVAYADRKLKQIALATDAGGSFKQSLVPNSDGGTNPAAGASADGKTLAVAWYDSVNENLNVASAPTGLTLAFQTPGLSQSVAPLPAAGQSAAACKPNGTTLTVAAQNTAFDTNCLAAPAGQAFTIDFDNKDSGTPHNVDIYDTKGGSHLAGANPTDLVTGPATFTYKVDALKAGSYYFQCDVHPTTMFGTFIVAKP